jgi:PKD repeat protein
VPDSLIRWTANGTLLGTGSSLTHTFTAAGVYTIEVVASDRYCLSSTQKMFLNVTST